MEDNFVFLETNKFSEEDHQSFIFQRPTAFLDLHKGDHPGEFFRQVQEYLSQGFFMAGWLSYELGYLLEPTLTRLLKTIPNQTILARLGVFPAPIIYDHRQQEFTTDHPFQNSAPKKQQETGYEIANLRPSITAKEFTQALDQIKTYIKAGDTYQVNFTLKYLFNFSGSPEELYKTLRRNQPVAYSAYLKFGNQRILSLSPELFFRKSGTNCQVKPMKGTMARGRTLEEDQHQAQLLHTDSKNRSENVMIVDLLRNDLGRLCQTGTVLTKDMFEVETFATLHQMTTTITGKFREPISLANLFRAIFPCGSVTGAPKIRTMEIINELENKPRGVYTGAIGYITPNGDATFNVPIRTIVLQNGLGEMGIGAGITHSSRPEEEWQESLLKGQFLSQPQPDFQLIETILWQPDKGFWLLHQHLDRMQNSAIYFSFNIAREKLARQLANLANKWQVDSTTPLRVRILLFRNGKVDISPTECAKPALLTLPDKIILPQQKQGLPQIAISRYKTDSHSNLLFHKTTRREFYDQERKRAMEQNLYEMIFCNKEGDVTEGTISNVIIKKADMFYTPPQTCGLLAGVGREYLLNRHKKVLHEETLSLTDMLEADAIYLVNSVRGVNEVQLQKDKDVIHC